VRTAIGGGLGLAQGRGVKHCHWRWPASGVCCAPAWHSVRASGAASRVVARLQRRPGAAVPGDDYNYLARLRAPQLTNYMRARVVATGEQSMSPGPMSVPPSPFTARRNGACPAPSGASPLGLRRALGPGARPSRAATPQPPSATHTHPPPPPPPTPHPRLDPRRPHHVPGQAPLYHRAPPRGDRRRRAAVTQRCLCRAPRFRAWLPLRSFHLLDPI
jgi:hypothetical protein